MRPHPTVAKNSYTHSGRGGAGNFFKAPATTPSAGVPTKVEPAPVSTTRFYSGRGGAGNAHASSERPVLSFGEEIARAEVRSKAAFAHVGRGGAGNVVVSNDATSQKSRWTDYILLEEQEKRGKHSNLPTGCGCQCCSICPRIRTARFRHR